jgi:hypothetical protein
MPPLQPVETLQAILELVANDSKETHPALCRVCKRMASVATPLLWNHVEVAFNLTSQTRPWGKSGELRYAVKYQPDARKKKVATKFVKAAPGIRALQSFHTAIMNDSSLALRIRQLDLKITDNETAEAEDHGSDTKVFEIFHRLGHLQRLTVTNCKVLCKFLQGRREPFFAKLVDATLANVSEAGIICFIRNAPVLQCFEDDNETWFGSRASSTWSHSLAFAPQILHCTMSGADRFWTPIITQLQQAVRVLHISGRNRDLLEVLGGQVETLRLDVFRAYRKLNGELLDTERLRQIRHLELAFGRQEVPNFGSLARLTSLESLRIEACTAFYSHSSTAYDAFLSRIRQFLLDSPLPKLTSLSVGLRPYCYLGMRVDVIPALEDSEIAMMKGF